MRRRAYSYPEFRFSFASVHVEDTVSLTSVRSAALFHLPRLLITAEIATTRFTDYPTAPLEIGSEGLPPAIDRFSRYEH
jgi:hypothetical protein